MKKALKVFALVICAIIIIILAYVAYVFIDYYRLDDNLELTPQNASATVKEAPTGEELSITSWNIGFGAYTDEFSFFMDGGKYSRGFSEEIVSDTMDKITSDLKSFNSDFIWFKRSM